MGTKRLNILVIDTDMDFVDNLRGLFDARDIDLVHTSDPEYAIEAAARESPSMIILNADVPKAFAVCRKLKKNKTLSEIPLVLTTIRASEETIEKHKTLNTRADYYFRKPFDADKLLELLPAQVPVEPLDTQDHAVIDDLKSDIITLSRQRDELQSQVSGIESLENQIKTYQGTVKALESSAKALTQRVAQLEEDLAQKKSLENNYLKQIEELKRNEGLTEGLNQQIESTTTLFEQLEQGYKHRIAALKTDNEDLSENILALQRKNAGLLEKMSQLEARTKGYDALKAKALRVADMEEDLQNMEKELLELREYQERTNSLQEKIELIPSMEAQLAVVQKERDELLSVIGEMEIQMKKTDQELHHTSEQYNKVQKDIATIRSILCTKE